jgi:beta-glucanase (GH16 family)
MKQQIYNWIIKQIFYYKYFFGYGNSIPDYQNYVFFSRSFDDLQWRKYLPWYSESKAFQDWNTYGIFKQQYGQFYFKARLDGLVNESWPAIWLLDMRSLNDVAEGRGDHPYYYEVDIELEKNHLLYSIHFSHNGEKAHETIWRSKFANHKLRRSLQKDFHLFLIDWTKDWIKFSIDGILSAKFRNEINSPLHVVMSKLSMSNIIVKN